VYVTRAVVRPRITTTKRTAIAIIVNGGDYTVTHLVVRFSISGHLSDPKRSMHVSAAEIPGRIARTDALGDTGTLTPGRGIRVSSALVEAADAEATIPVVRWTDRWEQRWEYRQGVPRRIGPGEPWNPRTISSHTNFRRST
jgi:hypothetical protein